MCHAVLQSFYVGPNYLEVDLDVHNYAFLARKALWSYHDRIATVVWDLGFVIQVSTAAAVMIEPAGPSLRKHCSGILTYSNFSI